MAAQTVLLDLDGTLHERGTAIPGGASAVEELRRAGHTVRLFTNTDGHLDAAFRAVRAGAELLALRGGPCCRAADGDHLDTGAIVAAIEYATAKVARTLGKPSQDFLRLAALSAGGMPADRIWVVGDERTTDIAMANTAGAISVQVRTGKYADQSGRDDLTRAAHVVDSVADVPALLHQALRHSP